MQNPFLIPATRFHCVGILSCIRTGVTRLLVILHKNVIDSGSAHSHGYTTADEDETDGARTLIRQWSKRRNDPKLMKEMWAENRQDRELMKYMHKDLGKLRMNKEAKLSDLTRRTAADLWFRRNRSKVYTFLVPLISLFYLIPAVQFVALVIKLRIRSVGYFLILITVF